MPKELKDIEVGDRVWVGDSLNPRRSLETVEKLPPTQIVLEGGARYRRHNYRQVGASFMHPSRITGIATPAECREWEAAQAEEKRQAEARLAEREQIDAKRRELNGLFAGGNLDGFVRESGDEGVWEVVFTELPEADVRRLAELLKGFRGVQE